MVRSVHRQSGQMVAHHAVLQALTHILYFFAQHGANFWSTVLPTLKNDATGT